MKIEVGESLCYSYLRHVKQCLIVQTNWKASEHWERQMSDGELENMFQSMKQRFDVSGQVFRGTQDSAQFMRQGEIDVIGIDQNGDVHAMDVAFHEGGLNYTVGVANNVLKKMLRTYLLLNAYMQMERKLHLYFLSPKVNRRDQQPLENIFATLREEYSETTSEFHLIMNDGFASMMSETLAKADTVADTSELFIRSSKLLNLAGVAEQRTVRSSFEIPIGSSGAPDLVGSSIHRRSMTEHPRTPSGQIQPIVRGLMKTLLEDHPTLLDEGDTQKLMDSDYCKRILGLTIGNFPLLRSVEAGRFEGRRARYWNHVYDGRFYVCSQWWKDHHAENAASLLRFVQEIAAKKPDNPGVNALSSHKRELSDYIDSQ